MFREIKKVTKINNAQEKGNVKKSSSNIFINIYLLRTHSLK